jgi:acyl-CoA synthetase (AMP-forming)/AMP-acid ligase II
MRPCLDSIVLLSYANAINAAKFLCTKFIRSVRLCEPGIVAAQGHSTPLPPDPARKLHERTGITIVQGYGLTESSPDTHLSPVDPSLMRLESAGASRPQY